MFRSNFRIISTSLKSVRSVSVSVSVPVPVLRSSQVVRSTITTRSFATSNDPESERLEKLITSLKSNPKIASELESFQQLLVSKGFETDKKPSMMQMMLIMTDKEIKSSIQRLKSELEAANISFTKEDVDIFMKLFGLNR